MARTTTKKVPKNATAKAPAKPAGPIKRLCMCGCGKWYSRSQALRHRKGSGTVSVRVAQVLLRSNNRKIGLCFKRRKRKQHTERNEEEQVRSQMQH